MCFECHFKALQDLFCHLHDPEYDRIIYTSNFRMERNKLCLLYDRFISNDDAQLQERKKNPQVFLPTLHPNMSEMVLLVHATLQWHNIGETQSKFLMLGDMLSVPGLVWSVSDRTGHRHVLSHTLPADRSWHAPSSLGSVRASLCALSGLAERVAERGAPEQPCCLWRVLRWEGWWWKEGGGEEGLKARRGKAGLSGMIRFSAECKEQPLPCFTLRDGGEDRNSPATECPNKAQAEKYRRQRKRERRKRRGKLMHRGA